MSTFRSHDLSRSARTLLQATLDKIDAPYVLVRKAAARMVALDPVKVDAALVRHLTVAPGWVDVLAPNLVNTATLLKYGFVKFGDVLYEPEIEITKDGSGNDVTHISSKLLATEIAGSAVEDDHTTVCVDLYWNYDPRIGGAPVWTESYSFSESGITTQITVTKNSIVVTTVGANGSDVVMCIQEHTGSDHNGAVLKRTSITVQSPDSQNTSCIFRADTMTLVAYRSSSSPEGGHYDRLVVNVHITPTESDVRICDVEGSQLAHTLLKSTPQRKRSREDGPR